VRAALRTRLDAVAAAVAPSVSARGRPRVLVLEWTDPPFVAGHWVPDLVTAAGGEPVLARAGQRSVGASWDEVRSVAADAVLVAPCGYGLADAVRQAQDVVRALGPAAAGRTVLAADAGGFVTRPGPRVVDAVEAFAAALHPHAALPARQDVVAAVDG
jgi:iron complex transport system substrate-binding protein